MRNPNGYGSVINLGKKRRNPFAVRVTVSWNEGKQQYKYISYHPTKKDAIMSLAKYNHEHLDMDMEKITFAEMYEQWLANKKQHMSKNNLAQYKMAFKIASRLHKMKFHKIKTSHLEECINSSNLARGTAGKVKSVYGMIYKYAMENDLALKNYAEFITINIGDEKTKEKGIFTEEDIKALWKIYHEEKNTTVENILILMYSGMRIQEMLNVKLDDIKLEERYLIGGMKTEAGKDRVIPIHEKLVPIFEERLANNKNYLVENKKQQKVEYYSEKRYFNQIMKKLNLKKTPHETRHTFISRMDSAGVSIILTKMIVGHAQVGVTAKTYIHKKAPELVEAINKID